MYLQSRIQDTVLYLLSIGPCLNSLFSSAFYNFSFLMCHNSKVRKTRWKLKVEKHTGALKMFSWRLVPGWWFMNNVRRRQRMCPTFDSCGEWCNHGDRGRSSSLMLLSISGEHPGLKSKAQAYHNGQKWAP